MSLCDLMQLSESHMKMDIRILICQSSRYGGGLTLLHSEWSFGCSGCSRVRDNSEIIFLISQRKHML